MNTLAKPRQKSHSCCSESGHNVLHPHPKELPTRSALQRAKMGLRKVYNGKKGLLPGVNRSRHAPSCAELSFPGLFCGRKEKL